MIRGITINNQHSWNTHRLRLLERSIGMPPKDEHKERVPYSNVTLDFAQLYGKPTYGDRTLVYKFEFLCMNQTLAQKKLDVIFSWFSYQGKTKLYDDMVPGYYFVAECINMSYSENHGIYVITVTFTASPFKYLVVNLPAYTASSYPDLNGDGVVDATDAAIILEAATAVGAGESTGLTLMQEVLADVDRDGTITATDASIVTSFATAVGTGQYENTPEGWAQYMNTIYPKEEGVL